MVEQDRSNDCRADCFGAWGGSATQDKCGVCMHVAATAMSGRDACLDCGGVVFGGQVLDNCGTCDLNRSNDCREDCASVWGASASAVHTINSCGICTARGDEAKCNTTLVARLSPTQSCSLSSVLRGTSMICHFICFVSAQ